ncbi:MAG: histidine phosphatase family protein [Rhodobacterales bacterium]
MPTYPPLYILRHGQTDWNLAGRCQGHLNSGLTGLGREQARNQGEILGPLLRTEPDMRVVCSPQGRARDTAEIALAGQDISVEFDPRVAELGAGLWTGMAHDEITARWPALFNDTLPIFEASLNAVGGEGYDALRARCEGFLADVTKPTVVISHGITCMMLRGLVCGLSYAETARLHFTQGCVFALIGGKEHILTR